MQLQISTSSKNCKQLDLGMPSDMTVSYLHQSPLDLSVSWGPLRETTTAYKNNTQIWHETEIELQLFLGLF